jgi:uncharacterized protein
MLGKLLLLALAIWMVLLLLKKYRRGIDKRPRPSVKPESQDMVSCKECGVHLPKNESILKKGAYFCCKEHSDKAEQ